MKYTILINQAGIVDAGLETKTDVVDWSLLDYIFAFQQSPKGLFFENKVWIDYKHVCDEMPLLGLNTKGAISNRVKKLRDLGLIETEQHPVTCRTHAKTTGLYYDITQFRGEPRKKPLEGVHQNEQGVHQNEQGVHQNEHRLDISITNHQEQKTTSLSHAGEKENPIFEKPLIEPKSTKPTVDKEIENLAILDVVNYLAAMSMTLPLEEAQAFIDHFSAQGWYTNGNPIADWRAKARQWHTRYMQFQAKKPIEAARKPTRGTSANKDFLNRPKYELPEEKSSFDNGAVIDSTANTETANPFAKFLGAR